MSRLMGVPQRRPLSPARSGRARLVSLDDVDAMLLAPGEILVEVDGRGFHPVHVARARDSVAGELEAQVPCVVVDARRPDGRCFTYAPGDLHRVQLRGRVRS